MLIEPNDIKYENRYSIVERKGGIYQLCIKNCKEDDTGKYGLSASNKIGEVKDEAKLSVITAPIFVKKFDQVDGVEKCDVKINFLLKGYPKPNVTLSKNNNQLDIINNTKYELLEHLENDIYSFTIIIKSANKNDAGQYQIIASNEAGRVTCLGKVSVHPLVAPKFLTPLENEKILPENKTFEIKVKVSGIPIPKISWFKDDKLVLDEDFETFSDDNSGEYSLKSKRISKDFSGVYSIKASNPGGEIEHKMNISINGTIPFFISKPEKLTCLEGTDAVLGCSFSGEPLPNATWSIKNKEITNDGKYIINYDQFSNSSILIIKNCSKNDEGTYNVTIKNIHGEESTPVTLMITKNAEEVQDYKAFLKTAHVVEKEALDEKIEWGELKEGKMIEKNKIEDNEQIKLKKVEILPVFIKKPENQKVLKEKESYFEAIVKSNKKIEVKWRLNEKELISKDGIRIEKDEKANKYKLTIKRSIEGGEIKCSAKNEHGEVEERCSLQIMGNFLKFKIKQIREQF